jgi:glycosyltransferase involved in cell wall biosynthesis
VDGESVKVLFFIGSLSSGGAERVTVRLANYLVHKGHQVSLVTMQDTDCDFYTPDIGVERLSLNLAGENRGLAKLTANWRRLRALRRTIRAEKPDIVVGMIYAATILCVLAALGLPVNVIGSERNYPGSKSIGRSWRLLRYLLYRFADGHVAQTREGADWIISRVSARNVTVIPNGVAWPLPVHTPRVDPWSFVSPERRLILAVGSKPEQKGFDLLLDAYTLIAPVYPDLDLVILGLASDQRGKNGACAQLQAQADEAGLAERVYFPGLVGNVGEWYERADLLVLSSRYEGFPNVLLEAMASGCACVAFDCDTGPRDLIIDGVNGILLEPLNVAELAQAISRVASSSAIQQRLGSRAKRVRSDFSEEKVFSQWCNYLKIRSSRK